MNSGVSYLVQKKIKGAFAGKADVKSVFWLVKRTISAMSPITCCDGEMVLAERLELPTARLQIGCSTN